MWLSILILIHTCDEREDIKADSVPVGLQGLASNLHGADAK